MAFSFKAMVEADRRRTFLNLDGREYIVNDWSEDMGIATVALGQTVTM